MTLAARDELGGGTRSLTVGGLLASVCEGAPDRTAILATDRTYSYLELNVMADSVASALVRDGATSGSRVAFLGEDRVACLAVLIGAARAGAVFVPINSRLAPPEIEVILADSGAEVLVVGGDLLERLRGEDALAGVTRTVILEGPGSGDARPWSTWIDGPGGPLPGRGDDPVVIQMYTSGTTGRPKGVLLTDANLDASIPEMCELWKLDPTSRMLGVLPMFHIAGLGAAIATLWSGATFVVADGPAAASLVDHITEYRVTNLVLASILLQRILEEVVARNSDGRRPDLSSLRVVGYGAAPISQLVLCDALEVLPCGLLQVYGLTECAGTLTVLRPEDHDLDAPDRLRSCGRPLDSLELRLVDPVDGRDVPTGQTGEIWVRSARVTQGYWQAPEATAEAITPDGWLRTGDIAYQDGSGYIYLCDRLRDMIVTGGENVFPTEVEDVIAWHPSVAEVAVIGVPDEQWGETLRAVVVPTPGSACDPADIIAFTRSRLAHFKCPTGVDLVESLPRNATGKVLRRVLRDPYWSGRTRMVN